jgi:tripartite-type tricarboxylate transporter receptor subunit TctC
MSRAATAQDYPTRSITIVVPFPAGGPTDALARVLAERMKAALGQSVIVENPTGAAGTIGTDASRVPRRMATRSSSATGRRTSSTARPTRSPSTW